MRNAYFGTLGALSDLSKMPCLGSPKWHFISIECLHFNGILESDVKGHNTISVYIVFTSLFNSTSPPDVHVHVTSRYIPCNVSPIDRASLYNLSFSH